MERVEKSPDSWGKRFRKDKITHAQNWNNYGGKAGWKKGHKGTQIDQIIFIYGINIAFVFF